MMRPSLRAISSSSRAKPLRIGSVRAWIVVTLALALFGCSSSGKPTPKYDPPQLSYMDSPIALCGAGLSNSTQTMLAAQWGLTGGKLTASFEQSARSAIFADENVNPSNVEAIYRRYTDCVRTVSETCSGQCGAKQMACKSHSINVYSACIEKAQLKCIDSCASKWGISFDQCRLQECNPNDAVNIENWNRLMCRTEQEQMLDCDYQKQSCLNAC